MAPINPCTNPNLPPIRIELSHIPCNESQAQYVNGVLAVKAYWRQATNMTLEDQVEYKTLIEQQRFEKQGSWDISVPSDYSIYKSCQASPTWAKYVFIKALDISTPALDGQMQGIFGSLGISDFEQCYRAYNPEPARELKRKAESELLQRSNGFTQCAAFPVLAQMLPHKNDLEELEDRLMDCIHDDCSKIRQNILPYVKGHEDKIERLINQMSTVIDKMNQLERAQTGYFNAVERKIDRMDAHRPDMDEV